MKFPTRTRFACRLSVGSEDRGAEAPGTGKLVDAVQVAVAGGVDHAWSTDGKFLPSEPPALPEHHDPASAWRMPGAPCTIRTERVRT